MKNSYFLLLLAFTITACTSSTKDNAGTNNDSTATKTDSQAVVVEYVPEVDTPAAVPAPPVADNPKTGKTTDSKTETGGRTGKMANPNVDLNAKTFVVTGHITLAGSYCGGAAPSPEIEAEAKKAKPFAKQPLLVRSGKTNALGTNLVTRTTTDANGDFSLTLPKGDYCLVLAEKESKRDGSFYNMPNLNVDKKCDDKWQSTCDISFTVVDKPVSGLRLALNKKCNITSLSPCLTYDGPLPSSAAPGVSENCFFGGECQVILRVR